MGKRLLIYSVISHPVALLLIYICPLTAWDPPERNFLSTEQSDKLRLFSTRMLTLFLSALKLGTYAYPTPILVSAGKLPRVLN